LTKSRAFTETIELRKAIGCGVNRPHPRDLPIEIIELFSGQQGSSASNRQNDLNQVTIYRANPLILLKWENSRDSNHVKRVICFLVAPSEPINLLGSKDAVGLN
jgi:hypothetical protein